MHRVECDCGRVLYEGLKYCPSCGRRIAEKPSTTKSPNNKESKNS